MYFYLISNLVLLAATLILEYSYHEHLFYHLKAKIAWIAIFFTIGLSWDVYGIYYHHWVYTSRGMLGIYVGVVPIEDFLWFLVVPYFCITVYRTFHLAFDKNKK